MVAKSRRFRKDPHQTIFFSILIGLLLVLAVSFIIFSNFKISQRRAELTAKIEGLREEIQILEKKNQELRAGIIKTESDSYWEERIREQGYKKPGEEQIVVLPPEGGEVKKEEEKTFWNPQNWWEWIKEKISR